MLSTYELRYLKRLELRHQGHEDQSSHGSWARKGKELYAEGAGTKDDPLRTNDVKAAAQALGEGKYVELESEREVSTLIDELAADMAVLGAEGKGKYDLCKVSVPGTNLFCAETKGVPRAEMPQLKGVPIPGSKASLLEANDKGEVDLGPAFVQYLASKGIGVTETEIGAQYLKASQNQLDGGKVAGMVQGLKAGTFNPPAIFATRDDYVVDGHHTWASKVSYDYSDGHVGDVSIAVKVIDTDIISALGYANVFAADMGIPQAGLRQLFQ